MNKIKLDILDKGGSIFYTDTDSIVTYIKLDDSLVGLKIGQFKLEHEITEGFFISNKTYCIINSDGDVLIKAKSADSRFLNYKDFIDLYSGKSISTVRNETITNYSAGSVTIKVPKKIKIPRIKGKKYIKTNYELIQSLLYKKPKITRLRLL